MPYQGHSINLEISRCHASLRGRPRPTTLELLIPIRRLSFPPTAKHGNLPPGLVLDSRKRGFESQSNGALQFNPNDLSDLYQPRFLRCRRCCRRRRLSKFHVLRWTRFNGELRRKLGCEFGASRGNYSKVLRLCFQLPVQFLRYVKLQSPSDLSEYFV